MFTVRIFFFGLIAFVPNESDDGMTAILIDVPRNYRANDATEVGKHYTCLQWQKYEYPCSRQSWSLDRKRVEFEWLRGENTVPVPSPMVREQPRDCSDCDQWPESNDDAAAFYWTIDLSRLVQDSRLDAGAVLEDRPIDRVASQIELVDGLIQTCRMVEKGKKGKETIPLFGFRSLGLADSWEGFQAIADIVLIEMTAPGGAEKLRINIDGFKDEETLESSTAVELEPYVCEGDTQCIELIIWNMPPPQSKRTFKAKHFEVQHELLDPPTVKIKRLAGLLFKNKANGYLQPACVLPAGFEEEFGVDLPEERGKWFIEPSSIENRPVCPMVQYP